MREHLAALDLDELADRSGVGIADIRTAAALVSGAGRGIAMWSMGLTHHAHGTDNIRALGNLVLARGWLGRPGGGLMPIRGHSNVQGVGSMGVAPGLKDAFARRAGEAPTRSTCRTRQGRTRTRPCRRPTTGGSTSRCWSAGTCGAAIRIRTWASEALRNVGLTVGLTTKLNPGHFHGRGRTSVLLPVLARDEEAQATTQESMFNYVRLS